MRQELRVGVGLLAVLLLLVAGCASKGGQQAMGAVTGGALAGGICAAAGGSAALCGGLAAAGAAAGWATVAAIQTHQERTRTAEAERQRYGWTPEDGRVVKIRDVTLDPDRVRAGEAVEITTDYSLMAADDHGGEPVTQTFSLSKEGERIHEWDPIDLPREAGGFTVSQTIPVPDGAEPGVYTVTQVLDARTRGPEVHTSSFSVIQ